MSRYIDATKLQKQIEQNLAKSVPTEDFYNGAMWVLKQVRRYNRTENIGKIVSCNSCKYQEDCLKQIELLKRDPVLELNKSEYKKLKYCSHGALRNRED